MTKTQKPIDHSHGDQQPNPGDKIITDLIEQRRLQQDALKKIMNSIDNKRETTDPKPKEVEKKRVRIQRMFSSNNKKTKKR